MTLLTSLHLEHFRCFDHLDLLLSPRLNWITGSNGSGKSSVLEALFVLGHGRSFRVPSLSHAIQHHRHHTCVRAVSSEGEQWAFQRKDCDKKTIFRHNGTSALLSDMARCFPVVLIGGEGYRLWSSREQRRRLLDWGVFHAYPESHRFFMLYKKALYQRNQLLRQHASVDSMLPWEWMMDEAAAQLDQWRRVYVEHWKVQLEGMVQQWAPRQVNMTYERGWQSHATLKDTLLRCQDRDRAIGYTRQGPHVADVRCEVEGQPVGVVFSRGQQKALMVCLQLAQCMHLYESFNQDTLLLIDDVISELDTRHQAQLAHWLAQSPHQMVLTSIGDPCHPWPSDGHRVKLS